MSKPPKRPRVPRLGDVPRPKPTRVSPKLTPEQLERLRQVAIGAVASGAKAYGVGEVVEPDGWKRADIIRQALNIGLAVLEMNYDLKKSQTCKTCGTRVPLP
jgi:hypothetical protein